MTPQESDLVNELFNRLAQLAKAVAYGKRIKIYPFSQADNPPPTKFVDAIDAMYGNVIPYNIKFFEELDRFVQREPWLDRDKAMIDQLKSIGIEKNKPFNPDAKTRETLEAAAHEAHAWLDASYETFFSQPYFEGTHWAVPAPPAVIKGMETNFADPTATRPTGAPCSIRSSISAPSIWAKDNSMSWKSRTGMGSPSTAGAATISKYLPTRPSNCIGLRRPTIVALTPSFVTLGVAVVPPILLNCKRMLTVQ